MQNLIRQFRKLRGWSSEALAEKVGTTAQQINFLENGKRKLTQEWMERIAKALNLSHPSMLLPGSEATHFADLSEIEEQVVHVLRGLDKGDQDTFFRFLKSFRDENPQISPNLKHIDRLRGGEKKSKGAARKTKASA